MLGARARAVCRLLHGLGCLGRSRGDGGASRASAIPSPTSSLRRAGAKATPVASVAEALELIERRSLMGRGIGWGDVQLLASALLAGLNTTTRSFLGASLLILALLAAVAAPAAATAQPDHPFGFVEVARGDATSADVLDVDIGRLELRGQPGGDGRALVGVVDVGDAQRLERSVAPGARLGVALQGRTPLRPRIVRDGPHWDLNLAADLPAAVTVRSRVGETLLDLRGTSVGRLELDAGIGDHEVYLPEGGAVARLSTRLGDLDVFLPRTAIVRARLPDGCELNALPEGFVRVPGGYVRDGAGHTIELTLGVVLGDVRVRTY